MTRLGFGTVCLLFVALACGDSDGPGVAATGGTGGISTKPDPDGGTEGPDGGGLVGTDGGGPGVDVPGSPEPGVDGQCGVASDRIYELEEQLAAPEVASVAVDPIESRFTIAYVAPSDECVDALYLAELSGGSQEGGPTINKAVDECSEIDSPAVEASGEGWLVAFVDDREGPHDLWVQPYSFDVEPTGDAIKIAGDMSTRPFNPEMALIADGRIALFWTEEPTNGSSETLKMRMLNADGTPRADEIKLASSERTCEPDTTDIDKDNVCAAAKCINSEDVCFTPWVHTTVRASALGDGLIALAYTRRSSQLAGTDEVQRLSESYLDILSQNGERVRETRELTLEAGPEGNVDVSTDDEGGAVAWTEGTDPVCAPGFTCESTREIWFQQIDPLGEAPPVRSLGGLDLGLMQSTRVLNKPFKGVHVSVVKLFTSYAVLYRQLPGGKGAEDPQLALTFMDERNSEVQIRSDVANTTELGGPISVKGAFDGRIVVGWTELSPGDHTIMKMVRLPCVSGG